MIFLVFERVFLGEKNVFKHLKSSSKPIIYIVTIQKENYRVFRKASSHIEYYFSSVFHSTAIKRRTSAEVQKEKKGIKINLLKQNSPTTKILIG